MTQVAIHAQDYFGNGKHWEVRRNYGTDNNPNWQTAGYGSTEQEALKNSERLDRGQPPIYE